MAFTCRPCREKQVGKKQSDSDFMLLTSYGLCESCGESSVCVDCKAPPLPESKKQIAWTLKEIADNEQLLEIGRRAIEEALVDYRDSRISELMRGNGLVIKEKNGADSSLIRFGPETALRIGLKAIHKELSKRKRV